MKILVVDDDRAVQSTYRHALAPVENTQTSHALKLLSDELFSDSGPAEAPSPTAAEIELSIVSQGLDAVAHIEQQLEAGTPYKVAFIDIRMPPGIDGKETARRIRRIDPDINLVIVTGYSDHSVTDIAAVAGPADKIFYIAKPFAADEVRQMARALTCRWHADALQVARLQEKVIELAASEARAIKAASHDFLTCAPNRRSFQAELGKRLREGCPPVTIALLDLDRFKGVNDVYGHGAGDELLKAIYATLCAACPDGTIIARLGGDEFGLLIEAKLAAAKVICDRAVGECTRAFTIYGNSVQIGASAGLICTEDYPDREMVDLIHFADLALFEAKKSSRGQVCVFDATMDESSRFRQKIELGLRLAIEKDEFTVLYQPIVEQGTLRVAGFEALLRWKSAELGVISPAVFIPISEEGALIHKIGDWVMHRALIDSRRWPEQYVSINFSPRQFKRANLPDFLIRAADDAGVPYARIQIEVTETTLFENPTHAFEMLRDLKSLGFRIAVDDFGTGYSSLRRVKNFALDCIKIDKSFVDELVDQPNSLAIISSITHLAHGLGLSVVAEGVETEQQLQALRSVGCTHLQGYLFGAAEELEVATKRVNGLGDQPTLQTTGMAANLTSSVPRKAG